MNAQNEIQSPRVRAWRRFPQLIAFACVAVLAPAATAPLDSDVALELTASDYRARLAELRAEIARHDELYFKRAAPEITDAEYDQLRRELRALEQRAGDTAPEEAGADPGARPAAIGDDRSGGLATARHVGAMTSLAKAHTDEEIRSFYRRVVAAGVEPVTLLVEPKYDGVAISFTYEHGRLVRAATRGNGREGDEVTASVERIRGVPARLRANRAEGGMTAPIPSLVEIRGEIFLGKAEFARLNRERTATGEELFAHPRSVAAGALRSLDPNLAAERGLEFVAFGWGAWEGVPPPDSQQRAGGIFRAWGLPVVEFCIAVADEAELIAQVREFGRARPGWTFPSDGVVVKVDSLLIRARLGEGAEGPNWALACKFAPERATTRLSAIDFQVGRTGAITPVAVFEPVELGGATIARASLHNAAELRRRDLRVGDWIFLERAGDVIPVIVGIDLARRPPGARPFPLPMECPSCRSRLEDEPARTARRCVNQNCPGQVRRRIEHFASSAGVDIAGLGPATIDRLVGQGLVRNAADLYRLGAPGLVAAGLDVATAERVVVRIAASREASLRRLIVGLGIPHIGPAAAGILAAQFRGLEEFAAAIVRSSTEESAWARGLTRTARESLAGWGRREENVAMLQALRAAGVGNGAAEAPPVSGPLQGKVVVLTGTLPGLTRAEATRRIEAAGGWVAEAVSDRTDILVVGAAPGAKLAEARERRIPVIDEAKLRELLGPE